MANKKISELTALGTAPASDDILPITDVSGTPQTKKVTITNLMSAAPVQSVAGRTGAVTLASGDVTGLGTAAVLNVGTAQDNVVQLDSTGLPAVDGSQLTGVTATDATKLAISNNLSDLTNAGTARTNLGLGDAATKTVGTGANNVVALDGSSRLPAVNGSQLTNLPSASVEGTAVLSTGETGGTKFLREDGDGTCSFQTVTVSVSAENLRGTDNPHIGAFPNQSFLVIDNPTNSVMLGANSDGTVSLITSTGAENLSVGFSVVEDATEPDIEAASGGDNYSVISGDSDSLGANGLPIRQGFNNPDIGANPSSLLISGGTVS